MTDNDQKQLGETLWSITDQLRGVMDGNDFRDYMLSFFMRYLSDNYKAAAQRELGSSQGFLYYSSAIRLCGNQSGIPTGSHRGGREVADQTKPKLADVEA